MAILSIGELLGMGPSELSGLIPYSGLEYSGTVITGISGSALAGQGGGTDPSAISAIASSYAESAASSKVDQSAFDDCCSSVNSALSGISAAVSGVTSQTGNYIDWSASGDFQPAGDYTYNSSLTGYVPVSAVSSWSSQIEQLSAIVSGMGEIYSLVAGSGVYISSNSSTKETVIGVNGGGGGGGISGPVYDLRAGNGLYVSSNSAISATEIGLV